ncbi:MAG: hypothetical protein N2C14_28965 [Planctomycetales bacterium]
MQRSTKKGAAMSLWDKFFGKKPADDSTEEGQEPEQAPVQLSEQGEQVLKEVRELMEAGRHNEAVTMLIGAANEEKDLLRTDLCRELSEQTTLSKESKSAMWNSISPAYRWNPDKPQ